MADDVLLRFIGHLRHHGIPVSPAETLDAMRVTASLGYDQPALLFHGLQSCLAKSQAEQQPFADCFAKFFALPNTGQTAAHDDGDTSAQGESTPKDADGGQQGSANTAVPNTAGRGGGAGSEGQRLQLALMEAATEIELNQIRYPTQRNLYRRRLLQALAKAQPGFAALPSAAEAPETQQSKWLSQQQSWLQTQAAALVDRQLALNNQADLREYREARMRDMAIGAMDAYHRNQLPELIRKLAKKLASRHRQHYRHSRQGRLNLGKTIKQSIAYDGVPFRRHWQSTRKTRSQLYVLCDISGSVATWSELLLLFLHALGDVIPKTRSFVFCDQSIEVTDTLQSRAPAQAVAEIFAEHGMGGSGYGTAIDGFFANHGADINRHTTVIILGDGRCNGAETGLGSLRKIYQRVRLVLWFNPEAESRWGSGDSEIPRFRSACHHIAECSSLRQLERLLDELLGILH